MELKRCSACKKEFPRDADHFNLDPTKKDGFYNQCRTCSTEKQRLKREKAKLYRIEKKYQDAVKRGHMIPGNRINWVSVSGGKDSTALILWTLKTKLKNCKYIYADTGHERPSVEEYLNYLEKKLGIVIHRIRKSSFLEACIKKKGFPSAKRRFCTGQLKIIPLAKFMWEHEYCDKSNPHEVYVGVRAEESVARKDLPEELESVISYPPRQLSYQHRHHPLLKWTWQEVFELHKEFNIEPNPLYKVGMWRVGCFPCIMAKKEEVRQILNENPWVVEKIKGWEQTIQELTGKERTFFHRCDFPKGTETGGIEKYMEALNNGKIKDIEPDGTGCFSRYGLCE